MLSCTFASGTKVRTIVGKLVYWNSFSHFLRNKFLRCKYFILTKNDKNNKQWQSVSNNSFKINNLREQFIQVFCHFNINISQILVSQFWVSWLEICQFILEITSKKSKILKGWGKQIEVKMKTFGQILIHQNF